MSEGADMRVHKSFLTNKIGPLPTWAWMGIGLGAAVMIAYMRADKSAVKAKTDGEPQGAEYGTANYGSGQAGFTEIGGSQRPPVITQLYNTSIFQPPVGGRTEPPACPPTPQAPCSGPTCSPLPQNCQPQGKWVRLESSCGPRRSSWASSLASIAKKFGYADVNVIWNSPENAQLKQRRKDPKFLHAGDRIFVPAQAPQPTVPLPPSY